MRRLPLILLCLLYFISANAQYFNSVLDCHLTYDWGVSVFIKSDKSFLSVGNNSDALWQGMFMNISNDGTTVLSCKRIKYGNANCYMDYSGRIKLLPNNNYLVPVTYQWPQNGGNPNTGAGIMLLDSVGDSVFIKLYTDTSKYWEQTSDAVSIPAGGFFIAGSNNLKNSSRVTSGGILRRTDSVGNLLWQKSYNNSNITSVQLLSSGGLLLGAEKSELVSGKPGNFYYRNKPHFIVVDSADGTVIKDTLYSQGFMGGGDVSEDMNGGYFHWGNLDERDPDNSMDHVYNFPDYVAHLDENFRIVWQRVFPVSAAFGHRYISLVRQIADSNYLLIGNRLHNTVTGWAALVDKGGYIKWEHDYVIDSATHGYLTDAVETPDGGFVFTGSARDNATAKERRYDVWLLSVDSNGCLVPGCYPNSIENASTINKPSLSIHPNPATDWVYIDLPESIREAKLYVHDMTGRLLQQKLIKTGRNAMDISAFPTGMYIMKITGPEGVLKTEKIIRN